MKPSKLKDHFEQIQKEYVENNTEYFNKGGNVEILSFCINWSVFADK
jgi:hypothetical protein